MSEGSTFRLEGQDARHVHEHLMALALCVAGDKSEQLQDGLFIQYQDQSLYTWTFTIVPPDPDEAAKAGLLKDLDEDQFDGMDDI